MKCPADGATLLMSERQGVEIDYCPDCRGVWLDRGELDKLLSVADRDDDRDDREDRSFDRDRSRDDDRRFEGDRPRKKKRSFLSEMFEFGGD
jgi:Zn-finger nucleic acid-binding protein